MLNDGIKKGQINKQVDWKGVWQEGYGCLTANGICPLEISPRCIFNLPLIKLQDWWIFCMTWSQLVKSPQVKPQVAAATAAHWSLPIPLSALFFLFSGTFFHFSSIYIFSFLKKILSPLVHAVYEAKCLLKILKLGLLWGRQRSRV